MNRLNRISIGIYVLVLWVVTATLFIFVNSAMDCESSHGISENVINIIIDNEENEDNTENVETKETWKLVVRKGAHMIEFAFLGISVICLSLMIYGRYRKSIIGFSFFYVLAIAVLDEYIQSFSDRSSSTGDIILDFCGALIGFFFGWLIFKLYEKIKSRYKKKIGSPE